MNQRENYEFRSGLIVEWNLISSRVYNLIIMYQKKKGGTWPKKPFNKTCSLATWASEINWLLNIIAVKSK